MHKAYIGKQKTPAYQAWRDMLRRCADNAAYADCSVCDEWMDFQCFAEWHEKNCPGEPGYNMDKDIKISGNRIYRPEACSFVPHKINKLIIVNKSKSGVFPAGVSENGKAFKAQLRVKGRLVHLGTYRTPEEAHAAYVTSKEEHVKKMAVEYRDVLGEELFESLMAWSVNG